MKKPSTIRSPAVVSQARLPSIIITNHGRDDLELISAEEYQRLRQLDQQAFFAHELPADVVNELGTVPIPEGARQFDDEYKPQ